MLIISDYDWWYKWYDYDDDDDDDNGNDSDNNIENACISSVRNKKLLACFY